MRISRGKISCIVPTFNRWAQLLRRLLEIEELVSICPFSIEVVVVDDHSCNTAPTEVMEVLDRHGWTLTRLHKNSGCTSIPRNVGISCTDGEFIMPIDDDVVILSSKFRYLPLLLNENCDLAYGGMLKRRSSSDVTYSFIRDYNPVLMGWGVDNSQIVYRRAVYDRVPIHFSRRACDWALMASIYTEGRFRGLNLPVSEYVFHGENRSQKSRFNEISPADYSLYFVGAGYRVDYEVRSGIPFGIAGV